MTKDDTHQRPGNATDDDVEAAGKMSEALEWVERARGHLYSFHQLMGHADFLFGDTVKLLKTSQQPELAEEVQKELVGRNVLEGRWTFQIIEEFDELYYAAAVSAEKHVRQQLMAGKRHVFESELKEQRRTKGRTGHESRPNEGGNE